MIKSFKLKNVLIPIIILALSIVLSVGIVAVNELTDSPFRPYVIVIDAGHGGRDNGCSGKNGTIESKINLEISKKLEKMLKDFGFKVVMTRENENGLYDSNADNYKVSDMEKRIEIIKKAKPDFVISIHQNSYPDTSLRGAQAFYQQGDKDGELLAKSIQSMLISHTNQARTESNYGDYYILKESPAHAVLVECGYLTNIEEEQLLSNPDYQTKISYAITCGIIKYFGIE